MTDREPIRSDAGETALQALRIVVFTGFAIVATVLAFVFLAPAGVLLAALAAWKGAEGVWTVRGTALRALSLLAFAAFATVATVMAFVFVAPAGVLLAAFFVWRGLGAFSRPAAEAAPREAPARTGNAAFDAYKADMLRRLEEEQASFEAFLARLRAARDTAEFDRFMEDRARRAATDRRDSQTALLT